MTVGVTGSGPFTFAWRLDGSPIPGATAQSLVLKGVTAGDAGAYDVVVDNTCGNATSAAATLTVSSDIFPQIVTQPFNSQTVCAGSDATFSVSVLGTSLTYQWTRFEGSSGTYVDIPGATAASYTLVGASLTDETVYRVRISNACGTVLSFNSALNVDDGVLSIAQHPADLIACDGGVATFEVAGEGTKPFQYQWRRNGTPISGATARTLVISPVTFGAADSYDVIVTSTCGTQVTSDPAVLTVTALDPTTIIVQPTPQTVCEGDPATFSVVAIGAGPLQYQWRHHGADIAGETSATLSIPAATSADACTYDVVVRGPCGAVVSSAAELTVGTAPTLIRSPQSRIAALDENVVLIVETLESSPTYQWYKGGTLLAGETSASLDFIGVLASDSGSYTVRVTGACGVTESSPAVLTVSTSPFTERVSVSSTGVAADNTNERCAMSGDGSIVAFESRADTLVSGIPDDSHRNIFARDRETGETFQVDANPSGRQLTQASTFGEMSKNIQWTALVTGAPNLVVGDTNGLADVFLLNRVTGAARRISIRPGFAEANGASAAPSISADGRYVAFESSASNLIASDSNGVADVFLYDRDLNTLRCISVNPSNQPGNGASGAPSISDDGQLVAFHSVATNLVTGDTNAVADIFVYDAVSGTIQRRSVNAQGMQIDGASVKPSMAANGAWLAFESSASNLVEDDTNGATDVFAVELATGLVSRCSVASGGEEIAGGSNEACITSNGRWVTFSSTAQGFAPDDQNAHRDVFVHDRDPDNDGIFDPGTTVTRRLSKSSASGPDSDGDSSAARIADNGAFVAFQSTATNLVDNDTNCRTDIFTASVDASQLDRVSLADNEVQVSGHNFAPTISGDPHLILFSSDAPDIVSDDHNQVADLVVRDVEHNSTALESLGWRADGSSFNPSVSRDGRFIAFDSEAGNLEAVSNSRRDVFIVDTQTRAMSRVSLGSAGEVPNDNCFEPAVSDDGRYVAFVSVATNLSPLDTNNRFDVYRRDRVTGQTVLVSVNTAGAISDGHSERPAISGDGRYIAFQSTASNLVDSDTNGRRDIFVRDVQAGTTTRVSVSSTGTQSNHDSTGASISSDGQRVAFESFASNLVAGDTPNTSNCFVHYLDTAVTTNVDARMTSGMAESAFPAISRDGAYVAFSSFDANLVPGDTNSQGDIFLRKLSDNSIQLASVTSQGLSADNESYYCAAGDGGRFVAFTSDATNLVPGDSNARADIFVHSLGGCLEPSLLSEPADQTVAIGQQIVLSVHAAGTGPLSYQWYFEDAPIGGATQPTLTISTASLDDAGDYYVEVSNACGLSVSRSALVSVQQCAPTVALASLREFGGDTLGDSVFPAISADGRYVAFHTNAGLAPQDASNQYDVYVFDRLTSRFIWVSQPVSASSPNNSSVAPSISADGRFVAFHSFASNLIAGDTNGFSDIFVYDRDPDGDGEFDQGNATLTRESLPSFGGQANRDCLAASISDNGRYVTFQTTAAMVSPAGTDRIYVRDRVANTTTLVSRSSAGVEPNNSCTDAEISGDGRFVAYTSRATNLVANDANIFRDIYVTDLLTGTTSLVSVSNTGQSLPGEALDASISRDGRRISFMSNAALTPDDTNNVSDIYFRDRFTQTTVRVSRSSTGGNTDGPSTLSSISDDGNFVAYYSDATNITPSDSNGFRDAFLYYHVGGVAELISQSSSGAPGDENSGASHVTGNAIAVAENGYAVAFISLASNFTQSELAGRPDIFVRIVDQESTARVSSIGNLSVNGVVTAPLLSESAEILVFDSSVNGIVPEDTNGQFDVFTRNRLTGETRRVTTAGDSRSPVVSADGRHVAFYSDATTLVPGDTNGRRDVFAYDTQTGVMTLISRNSAGALGNNESAQGATPVAISANGRFVAFESRATNFTAFDPGTARQIYLRDRDPDQDLIYDESNATTTLVSVDLSGEGANGDCSFPRVSADGRMVMFLGFASDLVTGDTNARSDIFVRDMQTGVTTRVSVNTAGIQSNANAGRGDISGDGRVCVWSSEATNLDPLATNAFMRVYGRDLQTGTTFLVSRSNANVASNSASELPRISFDGQRVVFQSFSNNLSPADTDSVADIYLRDLAAQTTSLISVNAAGGPTAQNATDPAISPDGDFIAYTSGESLTLPEVNRGTNVYLTDRRGCTFPTLLQAPQSQFVEEGATVEFTVLADAFPRPTYVWRQNGEAIPNSNSRTWTVEDVDASDVGTYTVEVSNTLGSVVSPPAQLGIGVRGDLNCDGIVSVSDIGPFVLALTNPAGYATQFPACNITRADINGDGLVTVSDIGPFVQLLTGGL